MENASKALIIAGAILLSILIIGLGMAVYNNATSSSKNANLDAQEIQAHNSQFLAYEGKQKGSNVKALISAIKNNNREYQDRMVKITFSPAAATSKVLETAISVFKSSDTTDSNTYSQYAIKSNTTYFVTFAEMDNGCIGGVDIHIYSDVD